jgi:hypothetical protein
MIYAILLISTLLITGCSQEETEPPKPLSEKTIATPEKYQCTECHQQHSLGDSHLLSCTDCHKGNSPSSSAEEAHSGLITQPAHPEYMAQNCGPCHDSIIKESLSSLHFTLKNKVNMIRQAFGGDALESLVDIPIKQLPETVSELSDDLLRRRCLRCHVYYEGDPYTNVLHGTGCAACHLIYDDGQLQSHSFIKSPPDSQCLHCHYGNFVGADYYGRYEHDYHWDYRTPYRKDGTSNRPFGVEFHQLTPDIHQLAGLICIDCHSGKELMTANKEHKISCHSCHRDAKENESSLLPDNVVKENQRLILTTKEDKKKIEIPQLQHPAHKQFAGQVQCQVCHAQWAFTDKGTHLLRQDEEDYDPFAALSVQGSFEVEVEVETSLYGDESYPYPWMADKITGETPRGLWLQGFELRRWEFPLICKDSKEVLHICRPILDLYLTYVDEEEEVIIDAAPPAHSPPQGLMPYIPHTTGKAGAFYKQRLIENRSLIEDPLFLEKHPREDVNL